VVAVLVYSDQPVLAKGLESLIAGNPAFQLTACCSSLAGLKRQLVNVSPDLCVLDLTPDVTSGALEDLQSLAPDCKIILWTDTIAGDFAFQALTIGIRGVLRKTLPLEAYEQCLQRVSSGELWFEKSLTDSFRAARRVSLTRREGQLVSMLARGLKNKEISSELGITEGTVKVYLSHLFQKSGARDRFELALQGMKNLGMAGTSESSHGGLRSLVTESVCR